MKITFNITYGVSNGEKLFVEFSDNQCVPMVTNDWNHWFLTRSIQSPCSYRYRLEQRSEWGQWREIAPVDGHHSELIVDDAWRDMPGDNVLYSSPFEDIFLKRNELKRQCELRSDDITLSMRCPWVGVGQTLAIVGGTELFGYWQVGGALRMDSVGGGLWCVGFSRCDIRMGDEYKFVILDSVTGMVIKWENGENRVWCRGVEAGVGYELNDLYFRGEAAMWRGAGVAIPVFSLRSEQSAGIGDFSDLGRFARWVARAGGRVVQVLPVNDTTITHTWRDSYPYKSVSIYALHPLYLSLEKMGALQDVTLAHQLADRIQQLNMLDQLDYEAVEEVKWQFFRALYGQQGHEILNSEEFHAFFHANKYWLKPYAVFSYLREINGTADFSKWGEWSTYDDQKAELMIGEQCGDYDRVAIYMYLQYYLDKQLRGARAEAAAAGVALKGDIPIGICRHSVEAWVEPHLFNMDSQAGAPPDDFSVKGQNWGFPTYNWEAMASDNYLWWQKRFAKMADYFDLYRIDHILGFFRIWQIPNNSVEGLLGHFNPALPFSREELSVRGLAMDDERFVKPFIHHDFLAAFLGDDTHIYQQYLIPTQGGFYTLRPEFDTQRKVEAYFADRDQNDLRDGLYGLINEVLFVRDSVNSELFHPRIAAQQTHSYKWLGDYEKWRFDELYNDFFYHRHNSFWAEQAMAKLPTLINSTHMMCCAEDLGMIPDCVADVLGRLQVVTLEIERMPKDPQMAFGSTVHYPYLSVCTTSTHDMAPVRLWWEENSTLTQNYYNYVMGWHGEAPWVATVEVCENIVERHMSSKSILAVLPLQDWLSMDGELRCDDPASERVNIPSDPNHYWRYRMHISVEDLERSSALTDRMCRLCKVAGRQ